MDQKFFTTKKGTSLPLINLKGKDYLMVPWRIVWFREEHPDWVFQVEYPVQNEKFVLAKAIILDETGKIRAQAHKVEHISHFQDNYEKAETGAIGRALAMIGYGTQFAPEFNETDDKKPEDKQRIVDTPVSKTATTNTTQPQYNNNQYNKNVPNLAPQTKWTNYAKK